MTRRVQCEFSFTPARIYGLANEDNEYFLLHCPQYHSFRLHLLGQISYIPEINLTSLNDTSSLCNLLLYGNTLFKVNSHWMRHDARHDADQIWFVGISAMRTHRVFSWMRHDASEMKKSIFDETLCFRTTGKVSEVG